jgi:uncharacterized protein YkwD
MHVLRSHSRKALLLAAAQRLSGASSAGAIRAVRSLCSAAFVAGVGCAAPPIAPPPPSASGTAADRAAIAAEIVTRTNAERTRAGLRAFTTAPKLMEAARIQAEQMAAARRTEHTISGARYPTMQSRFDAAGYDYLIGAENIARNQPTVTFVVDAWMRSAAHRANILNPQLTQIGAAMARSINGEPYWVQVFGRPR